MRPVALDACLLQMKMPHRQLEYLQNPRSIRGRVMAIGCFK
jgi:hypothetical protein